MMRCPDEADLLRFADGALSVEETERIRGHIEDCKRCGLYVDTVHTLLGDLAAVDVAPFDAQDHVRAVRRRIDDLDRASPRTAKRGYGVFVWAAGSLAAAAVAVALIVTVRSPASGSWQARGGRDPNADSSGDVRIARDVGVQIYAAGPAPHALSAGAVISPDTPMTAGFRNLGRSPSYLLLFAVDERGRVHWISPASTRREDDPPSTLLPTALAERVLPTTAVLENVPSGSLRLVAVITPTPAHVSEVEALEGTDVSAERIERTIPGAEVRETRVEVARRAPVDSNPGGHP